jgi:hypothetical protein
MIRPAYDMVYPLVIIIFLYFHGERNFRSFTGALSKYFLVYVFIMSIWWIHNYKVYNQFVRLNLGFGKVLYEGHNKYNANGGPTKLEFLNLDFINHNDSKILTDQKYKDEAIRFIRSDYLRFIKSFFVKFKRFWNPLPNHALHQSLIKNIVSGVTMVLLYLFGAGGAIIVYRRHKFIFYIFLTIVFYTTLIHVITVASVRYRYPIEPLLIIFASFAINHLIRLYGSSSSSHRSSI